MTFVLLKEILAEAPILVEPEDFNLGSHEANVKFGQKLRANPKLEKIQDLEAGFVLYKLGNMFAVFLQDEPEIFYLMRFKTDHISMIGEAAATQILVWASVNFPISVAKLVFFEHLLPAHNVIATDGKQTTDGRRFWKNRVADAFSRDLWVYFADLVSTPRKLIRITDSAEFVKLAPQIWGATEKFRARKLLISNHPLKAEQGVEVED